MPYFRHIYESLLNFEIYLNHYAQQHLRAAEPFWIFLSEQFTTARIMDVFVPLVAVFNNQIKVRLVCALGVINAINSLLKWSTPEYRPHWWLREMGKSQNLSSIELHQYPVTCETTPGFPSSHAMSFTPLSYIFTLYAFKISTGIQNIECYMWYVEKVLLEIVILASAFMWMSRIYLGTEFLHQCIAGTFLAIKLLNFFEVNVGFFFNLTRPKAVAAVVLAAWLPVLVYFAMLHADIDPHWSVRTAFKWCKDPSKLRHEASPIFLLARDFGYLLGIAFSAPLCLRYSCYNTIRRRAPIIFAIEALNYYARKETPKHYGRVVFVGYECLRNALHSYSLLSIVTKLR